MTAPKAAYPPLRRSANRGALVPGPIAHKCAGAIRQSLEPGPVMPPENLPRARSGFWYRDGTCYALCIAQEGLSFAWATAVWLEDNQGRRADDRTVS